MTTDSPDKPRGRMGWLSIGATSQFVELELPRTKPEIERYIANRALAESGKLPQSLYDLVAEPIQNPENDFDFTLLTRDGTNYLDLVEVFPSSWVPGQHGMAPPSYNNGEFADALLSVVEKKSRKYGLHSKVSSVVHLPMYPTDWRLRITSSVCRLLAHSVQDKEMGFRTVAIYQPHDDVSGELSVVYPVSGDVLDPEEAKLLRSNTTLLADLTTFRVEASGKVRVPIAPPLGQKKGK